MEDTVLVPLTRLQCTWQEWRDIHPETLVLDLPRDPRQADPREGHGAEEYFARPAMDQIFIASLVIELNRELPESEAVIGLNTPDALRAYPIFDLKQEGGVLNDDLAGRPIVLLTGPEPDSIKTMVFDRRVEGRSLTFTIRDGRFMDAETDGIWTIDGRCVQGVLDGSQLAPVHFAYTRWHSWCYTHPGGEIWRTARPAAPDLDLGVFAAAVESWRAMGHAVDVERAILNVERPLESAQGFVLRVNGDRLKLHRFETPAGGDDYGFFHPHSVRRGLVVVESEPDPQEIFTDIATQRVVQPGRDHPLVFPHRRSRLRGGAEGHRTVGCPLRRGAVSLRDSRSGTASPASPPPFPGIATPMNQDVPIFNARFTTTGRLPGVDNGAYAMIGDGDNFVIYRFESPELAECYVTNEEPHAFAAGRYVFRSIPVKQVQVPPLRCRRPGAGEGSLVGPDRKRGLCRRCRADRGPRLTRRGAGKEPAMKVTRYRTEEEKERIAGHIGKWDESKAFFSTPRMRREVFYPLRDPQCIPAAAADFMLDDDHVVGIYHNGEAKAYPMFILDMNHHLDDTIGGDPIVYST